MIHCQAPRAESRVDFSLKAVTHLVFTWIIWMEAYVESIYHSLLSAQHYSVLTDSMT